MALRAPGTQSRLLEALYRFNDVSCRNSKRIHELVRLARVGHPIYRYQLELGRGRTCCGESVQHTFTQATLRPVVLRGHKSSAGCSYLSCQRLAIQRLDAVKVNHSDCNSR